jgi:hypothetical protein
MIALELNLILARPGFYFIATTVTITENLPQHANISLSYWPGTMVYLTIVGIAFYEQ